MTSDRLFDVRSRPPTPLPPVLVQVFFDSPVARVGAALELDVLACTDPTLSIAPDTAAVIVAAYGRDEEPVLRAALAAKVPYIALLASPRPAAAVLTGLEVPELEKWAIRAPAGLDIGARTPAEIAH